MLATPLSHWIGFHLFILILFAAELAFARRQSSQSADDKTHRNAIVATAVWIAAALAVALFIYRSLGHTAAIQYIAGYTIEESLSIDNLFVFLLLFRFFHIEPARQPKVLFWGVFGAIPMRAAFIAAGLSLLAHFHWISYIFALILLAAAIRLFMPHTETASEPPPVWLRWLAKVHPVSLRQDCFFVPPAETPTRRPLITVLFLCLAAIELTDLIFALDSIPAVLSITSNPFLAYTSNIMAIMGLRSLYYLLAHLLDKLRYLHYGLATILLFAAIKMLAAPWFELGPVLSLFTILVILAVTIALSLLKAKTIT